MPDPKNQIDWDEADWRLDTEMLNPEARGVYRDILGWLYLQKDRSGVITGSREEIARAGRCSAVQVDSTLKELARHRVADVSERNGVVTVINRRMKRLAEQREMNRLRVKNHRCNGDVTGPPVPYKTPIKAPTKLTTKGKSLTPDQWETARRFEHCLNGQWVNDAGKWVNRIKSNFNKCLRVVAELEGAIREQRVNTTPAQFAEQTWKEFA